MAARKKAKTSKKSVKRAKAKKKTPTAGKTKRKKAVKKAAARRPARKKAAPVKAAKKAAPRGASARAGATKNNRKQIVGEGDYEASRSFLKDQAGFVKENKARIPEMGRQARAALEGSEGPALMAAEAEAKGHSKNNPEESEARP